MPALIGRYEHTLDDKNRMFVPSRYREMLHAEGGRHFILSMGLDRCVYLFLPSQWERLLSQSQELFQFKDKRRQRAVKRVLFSSAQEAGLDEQGRILIPQHLRLHGGLRRELMVVGTGNKAEIWAKAGLRSQEKSAQTVFKQLSADLDL